MDLATKKEEPIAPAYVANAESSERVEEAPVEEVPIAGSPDVPVSDVSEGSSVPVSDVSEGSSVPASDVSEGSSVPASDVSEGSSVPASDVSESASNESVSPGESSDSLSSIIEESKESAAAEPEEEEMFIKEAPVIAEIPQKSIAEIKDEELLHEAELFRLRINKSGTLKRYFKMSEKYKNELRTKLIHNYMNVLRISTRKNLTDKHHKLVRNIRNTFNRRLNTMDKMRKRKTKSKSKK